MQSKARRKREGKATIWIVAGGTPASSRSTELGLYRIRLFWEVPVSDSAGRYARVLSLVRNYNLTQSLLMQFLDFDATYDDIDRVCYS